MDDTLVFFMHRLWRNGAAHSGGFEWSWSNQYPASDSNARGWSWCDGWSGSASGTWSRSMTGRW
jgi:hypothetical protein